MFWFSLHDGATLGINPTSVRPSLAYLSNGLLDFVPSEKIWEFHSF